MEGFSLATTTLLQRHANEGESIAEAIRDCLDYGKNPEKTEDGKYISSYECDPATVAAEFLFGKGQLQGHDRLGTKEGFYQIRQSFYPGEITPEEANRISYALDEGPPRFHCHDTHRQAAYPLTHLLQFYYP